MFVQLAKDGLGRKAGEVVYLDDADARRLVRDGAAPAADDPLVAGVTRGLDAALEKFTASLERAADASLRNLLQAPRGGVPAAVGAGGDPTAGFRNFGEFALAVKHASLPGTRPDDRLFALQKAPTGLGEQSGGDGGFLVPPEFSAKLLERVSANDTLLGRTDGYTVAGNSLSFPRSNETSRATGSRFGGVRGYWLDEGSQVTHSKPGYGRLDLKLHKLAVLIYATDELLGDVGGTALEQYLLRVGAGEINFLVGDAVINGTGAGQPLGLLNSNCLVTVSKETGQAAATLKHENVVKMWARLFAGCRTNAVWLVNQDVEPQLHTMSLGVGTGGLPSYLPPGGLSEKPYATLLGRPVLPVEFCPTLGTKGDVILADLSQYVTVSRGAVESAMSMHLRFDYDETAFRLIFRIDGAPWWSAPLTPFKGSNTQSCFVALETRS